MDSEGIICSSSLCSERLHWTKERDDYYKHTRVQEETTGQSQSETTQLLSLFLTILDWFLNFNPRVCRCDVFIPCHRFWETFFFSFCCLRSNNHLCLEFVIFFAGYFPAIWNTTWGIKSCCDTNFSTSSTREVSPAVSSKRHVAQAPRWVYKTPKGEKITKN